MNGGNNIFVYRLDAADPLWLMIGVTCLILLVVFETNDGTNVSV